MAQSTPIIDAIEIDFAGPGSMVVEVTPAQVRAARGLLNWSMLDLARAAAVSVSAVKRVESEGGQPVPAGTRETVRAALERAGVVLTDDDDRCGVMLRLGVP